MESQGRGEEPRFFEELEGEPDADFQSMADRLVTVIENERDAAADREEALTRMLEDAE